VIPDVAVPGIAIPDAAIPDVAVPDLAVPDAALPDLAAPDIAIPDAVMPDLAVPDIAIPDAVGRPDVVLRDAASPDLAVPDTASASTPDATVSGALPRFVDPPDAGGSNQLLTCIAHLYGQTVGGVPLHPIGPVSVANPGSSPADVIVTAQLQNYSDPSPIGLHVPANGTAATPPIDLTFDFAALYAVSAPVTANATLQLASAGNAALLDAHTKSITILPKNTIYWAMPNTVGTLVDTSFFIGAFVTPHDQKKSIDQLLKDAASLSRCKSMLGYETPSCMSTPVAWSPASQTVPAGYCEVQTLQATAGTAFDVTVDATCTSLCTSNTGTFYVFTQSDWLGTQSAPLKTVDVVNTWSGGFTAPANDTYVLAACNPSTNSADRIYKITAAGDPILTGDIDQMSAIFLALKARGLQYVDVPQDFFLGAQNVRFPVETLATASANCIDGTLVFASALESMGMRAGIVKVPGHAFVAVLVADPITYPSIDPCVVSNWLPIETTMVATDTPIAAIKRDLQADLLPTVTQVFAKGCAGYPDPAGNATIFDVKTLRDLGILPAPM